MSMVETRILVIGAGVNGSIVATRLFRTGLDVRVLARGRHYEAVRDEGIIIENPFSHKRTATHVPVIDTLSPEDCYDFVLVIVRKNQALELLPLLAANRSPNIVFMGNNLSGPGEFTKALGADRIMLGSVVGAGKRDGDIIRAISTGRVAAPFGEIDGSITPRLERLVRVLNSGGVKAGVSTDIVDFQMTHAAGVAVIGVLTMKHDCDVHSLARSTEDLRLFVEGRLEGQRILRALDHKIVPASEAAISSMPAFLQLAGMRLLLNSKLGEVGLAYHVSQAPDEILQLAKELRQLANQVAFPVPAIRKVLEFC